MTYPVEGTVSIYLRGTIWWAKIGGQRFSLNTRDPLIARQRHDAARFDRELNDDGYFVRAIRSAEGHRRRRAARERGAAERQTVNGALNHWLRACAVDLRPSTVERYRVLAIQWRRRWGQLSADKLTAERLDAWRTDRLRAVSRSTVKFERAALKSFLQWAQRVGLIEQAPAIATIRGVARKRSAPAALEPDEVERLIAAARGLPIEPAIWIGAYAGLRRGELLALRWADVREGLLHVRPSKTPEARQVPVAARLGHYLAELRDREPRTVYIMSRIRDLSALSYAAKCLWTATDLRRPGMPTLHGLRHHFATQLVRRGVDLETIKQLMGHSSVAITEIYLSTNLDRMRNAVAGL